MKTEVQLATQKFKEGNWHEFCAIVKNNPEFLHTAGMFWFDMSSRKENLPAMDCLYGLGIDLNKPDSTGTPLSKAASDGAMKSVQWLLDKNVIIDESSITNNPLFAAIQGDHVELVKLFIELGVDTKKVYPCGRDALAFSENWGNSDIISLLGGDPNRMKEPWVNTKLRDFTGEKVTEEMLEGIQNELHIVFPEYFKNYLQYSFPPDLFFKESKDNDDWEWLGSDSLLFHTARSYIAYNSKDPQVSRKELLYSSHIAFGTNGAGDFWCIKKNGEDDLVSIYEHELDSFTETGTSFAPFVQSLIDEYE
ncbi:ankyrin repeat domain-containing protein [Sedimenticola sp.]|uniref:ankyrin repeat domain-containing protein n=1 Tax=Sedimenticola sp. TaxID=1940285 RepID=UPI003D148DC4